MNKLNFALRLNKYDNTYNHWHCTYKLRGRYSRISLTTKNLF